MSAPPFLRSDCLGDAPGIAHAFFTRAGGVSTGLYATLNAGFGSADRRDAVTLNRARCAAALGLEAQHLLTVFQIHSSLAVRVEAPWAPEDAPRVDGMVTATPGIGLGILAADCAPLLLADPAVPVVGAAHAGWRGALSGVIEATLEALAALGARPERILAAIGPTIGPCHYEVGPEFEARFRAADPDAPAFFVPASRTGHFLFDLPGYAARRLERAGVGRIERLERCTYGEEDSFFSFRRATHRHEGDYGRNLSVIALR